jgi:hypothetical protein
MPRPDVVIGRVSGTVNRWGARLLAKLASKQLDRTPHVVRACLSRVTSRAGSPRIEFDQHDTEPAFDPSATMVAVPHTVCAPRGSRSMMVMLWPASHHLAEMAKYHPAGPPPMHTILRLTLHSVQGGPLSW